MSHLEMRPALYLYTRKRKERWQFSDSNTTQRSAPNTRASLGGVISPSEATPGPRRRCPSPECRPSRLRGSTGGDDFYTPVKASEASINIFCTHNFHYLYQGIWRLEGRRFRSPGYYSLLNLFFYIKEITFAEKVKAYGKDQE